MTVAAPRPLNFSSGPAILPLEVLERAKEAIGQLGLPPELGLEGRLSILEISHRSRAFDTIHQRAIERVHTVLGVPRTHRVLLLQGGASLQFSMVGMNLLGPSGRACFIDTGVWSTKAYKETSYLGQTEIVASSAASRYDHIPAFPHADRYAGASFLHITTNNTIYGTEFPEIPQAEGGVPLVADMSSNIGSRPMALDRLALGYAGAQKNLGPSGVTLVFIEESLLERKPQPHIPTFLHYRAHADNNSLLNTPNTFGILVLDLVLEWMASQGGVEAIGERNARKAAKLYRVIDESALFVPHAQKGSRSTMNVTWTLAGGSDEQKEQRTKAFLAACEDHGLSGLKGHRSVGGCRASIYNAFPETGVDTLCEFLREYERTAG